MFCTCAPDRVERSVSRSCLFNLGDPLDRVLGESQSPVCLLWREELLLHPGPPTYSPSPYRVSCSDYGNDFKVANLSSCVRTLLLSQIPEDGIFIVTALKTSNLTLRALFLVTALQLWEGKTHSLPSSECGTLPPVISFPDEAERHSQSTPTLLHATYTSQDPPVTWPRIII
jgi:hypothetical protein